MSEAKMLTQKLHKHKNFATQVSPSPVWAPGMEPRLSGLASGDFTS